jgi:hypothetical protein
MDNLLTPAGPGPHAPLSAEKLAGHQADVEKFAVGTRVHLTGAMHGRHGTAGLITEIGSDAPALYEVVAITPIVRNPCSTGGTYVAGPYWTLRSLGNTIATTQEDVIAPRMTLA